MRFRAHATLSLLLATLACQVPSPSPERAAARSAASLPAGERKAYLRGFMNGALMPTAAGKEHERPVEPSLAESSDELDPATGLVRWDLSTNKADPWARGTADGFAWALRGSDSCPRANPVPVLPDAAAFTAWSGESLLRSDGWAVLVDQRGSALVWSARFQGFEPVRGWRDVSPLGGLKAVALERGALWVAGVKGAWALDIPTSALRRIEPPLPGVPIRQEAPEGEEGGMDLKSMAEKGDVQAMIAVAQYAEQDGNYEDALAWYQRAVAKGDAKAMEHLAMMAALGRGGPVDKPKARQWLEKAQAAGDKDAPGLLLALDHPEKLQAP